jgi:hypothetical protein
LSFKFGRDIKSCDNLLKFGHIFINSKGCKNKSYLISILDVVSFSLIAQK